MNSTSLPARWPSDKAGPCRRSLPRHFDANSPSRQPRHGGRSNCRSHQLTVGCCPACVLSPSPNCGLCSTMKLFDVNPLIYAFREDSTQHREHRAAVLSIVNGAEQFSAPDIVLAAVIRICTNPRIYRAPSEMSETIAFVNALRSSQRFRDLPPDQRQWDVFTDLCSRPGVYGGHVTDALIASFAIANDAGLVTSDRAMSRFPGLRVEHPFEPVG